MQRAQKAPLPLEAQRVRASRTAWAIVLAAFILFCALGGSFSYAGLRFRNDATSAPRPGARLIVRSPDFADSVTWTERGTTNPRIAADGQELNEGDSIAIPRTEGSPFGQMASLRLFDQTQLDLWAGADLTLATMQTSRWSGQLEEVVLVQRSGYARYDLEDDQPFAQVVYRVRVGNERGAEVLLTPGGSYSIDIRPATKPTRLLGPYAAPPVYADVAVRSGEARVRGGGGSATVRSGEKVALDAGGLPSLPVPARWELIADSRFGDYTQEQYNNTTMLDPSLQRSGTWQVTSQVAVAGDQPNGFFKINRYCLPLGSTGDCSPQQHINAANFFRAGNQTTSFITGVRQSIDRDVSEYRSLDLSLKLRVLNQSLSVGGVAGTECPIMVVLRYKNLSPADDVNSVYHCFFYRDEEGEEVKTPEIQYHQVKQFEWFTFSKELRSNELANARYIQEIQIYSSGHDYNAEITDISLIGSQ
jgi:hypothetical protein